MRLASKNGCVIVTAVTNETFERKGASAIHFRAISILVQREEPLRLEIFGIGWLMKLTYVD
jgi:hypothetical protein